MFWTFSIANDQLDKYDISQYHKSGASASLWNFLLELNAISGHHDEKTESALKLLAAKEILKFCKQTFALKRQLWDVTGVEIPYNLFNTNIPLILKTEFLLLELVEKFKETNQTYFAGESLNLLFEIYLLQNKLESINNVGRQILKLNKLVFDDSLNHFKEWKIRWKIASNYDKLGRIDSSMYYFKSATESLNKSQISRYRLFLESDSWNQVFNNSNIQLMDPDIEFNIQYFFSEYVDFVFRRDSSNWQEILKIAETSKAYDTPFGEQLSSGPNESQLRHLFPNYDSLKREYLYYRSKSNFQIETSNIADLFSGNSILYFYYAESIGKLFIVKSNNKNVEVNRIQLSKLDLMEFRVRDELNEKLRFVSNHISSFFEGFDLNETITIVPHHFLYSVPFAAIRDSVGSYLIESYSFKYANRINAVSNKKSIEDNGFLLVTSPDFGSNSEWAALPFSKKEGQLLSKKIHQEKLIHLNEKSATESNIKKHIAKHNIIHFSTHSFSFSQNPFLSSIVLGPDDREDGYLTSKEIVDMDIQADLVNLNSCNSGNGPIYGSGVDGLADRFLTAGASNVSVLLWKVNDEIATIFSNIFYDKLIQGMAPVEALKVAQVRIKSYYPSPEFWAPFVIYGSLD